MAAGDSPLLEAGAGARGALRSIPLPEWSATTRYLSGSCRNFSRHIAEQKAETAYFNILVPLRGTALHERLKAEGRLIDEENMERWPGLSCHVRLTLEVPEEAVTNLGSGLR